MRFKLIDGGDSSRGDGGSGDGRGPHRPSRRLPQAFIDTAWLDARLDAIRQMATIEQPVTERSVSSLIRRGAVSADAYTSLAMLTTDDAKAEELLAEAMLQGVFEVFAAFVDNNIGRAASYPPARPYLRALSSMAQVHALRGELDLALTYWDQLDLLDNTDPTDDRGWRYAGLMLAGRLADAETHWQNWRGDTDGTLVWCRPLQLKLQGDLAAAAAAVAVARALLPDHEAVLSRREVPLDIDPELGAFYLESAALWQGVPRALSWLAGLPKRDATDDDYVRSGWPVPVPGIDLWMLAHLNKTEVAFMQRVVKGINAFAKHASSPRLVPAALDIANALADRMGAFFSLTSSGLSAACLSMAAQQIEAEFDLAQALRSTRATEARVLEAFEAIDAYGVDAGILDDDLGGYPLDV